jgi:hemoglobin/transferrin/lactoferrin receptor protein
MKKALFVLLFAIGCAGIISAQNAGTLSGVVKDANGDVVAGASVTLRGTTTTSTTSDAAGAFRFEGLQSGGYSLRVVARGFGPVEQAVQVATGTNQELNIELAVAESRVTVSAEIGRSEETVNVPQAVNVVGTEAILERVTSVLAQAGEEEAGLNLQRTSPSIGAIVIRGLTGKNVVNFVDGVRFTHGGQRGGINTFFNLNEPTNLQAVEVVRGPNGAQYGSDSLSGTVNLITKSPAYGKDGSEWHGDISSGFTTADSSFGGAALVSYGTRRFGGYLSAAGRRIGDLRSADGRDSHSAITRFLGLPSTVLYRVNPDTGFVQYGGAARFHYSPLADQQLIFHYQRSNQDGGKRFDQLVGGDGNLIADLRNLMLDFGYLRYLKQGLGFFDHGSFTGSFNSQREERVNQGGQGNPVGDITHQYERTTTLGTSFFVDKATRWNNLVLIGGDFYSERINSPAYIYSPVTQRVTLSRPRVPDEATFRHGGIFVQDQWDVLPDRVRITGALRYGGMSYRVRSADSPLVNGLALWPDDELTTADFSGRLGVVVRPKKGFRLAFNYGRGFRYPNMTDLGTLGLTGDGFEVDHVAAAALGGSIGTTANASAVSTGLPVTKQESEYSNSYEAGIRYQNSRFDTEFTLFRLDIVNAITKQALILPPGSVGRAIAGNTITNQTAGGAVFIAASTAPVLARANFTSAKIWGVEYEAEAKLRSDLILRTAATYIHAADKESGLPPNIEGGTPPPNIFIGLRYNRSRFWVEPHATLAARQDRLSSLDLSDRRTGAARTRNQIQNYFRRGACVLGLTTPGPTGCGSAGGILIATGETLAQVQARVLPGVTDNNLAVPLYTYLPGYGVANIRGGITINDRASVFLAFENIFDQFYRNPSWGVDGPGRSFTAQFRYRF